MPRGRTEESGESLQSGGEGGDRVEEGGGVRQGAEERLQQGDQGDTHQGECWLIMVMIVMMMMILLRYCFGRRVPRTLLV